MKVLSRRVQIKKGDKIFLDTESEFLHEFRMISRIIHPKKTSDIVLREGIYTLVLGDIRMKEFTED